MTASKHPFSECLPHSPSLFLKRLPLLVILIFTFEQDYMQEGWEASAHTVLL